MDRLEVAVREVGSKLDAAGFEGKRAAQEARANSRIEIQQLQNTIQALRDRIQPLAANNKG